MVVKAKAPQRGEVISIDFNPVRGHEQAGKRPAVVISPSIYNLKSGLALVCPITSHSKGYPFEILFEESKFKGVILTDQIRMIDWRERKFRTMGNLSAHTLELVKNRIKLLVD